MEQLLELLQQLKEEDGAELVKVYFQDINNYSIKLIKDGNVCRRIKKGHTLPDLKESEKKGVVDKKKRY